MQNKWLGHITQIICCSNKFQDNNIIHHLHVLYANTYTLHTFLFFLHFVFILFFSSNNKFKKPFFILEKLLEY
jgi:hypothetical protein